MRLQIDTMLRDSDTPCVSNTSPSSSNGAVSSVGLGQVCMGSSEPLILPLPNNSRDKEHRATSAMRVRWGDAEPGGSVEWEVDADLSEYSFLSLRAGQINHASPHSMVTIRVGIAAPTNGMGTQVKSVDVDLYTQDDTIYGSESRIVNFMRTIRIPLTEFCAQGTDISQVESIVIEFVNDTESRSVLLDSIEFTRALDSEDGGQCL